MNNLKIDNTGKFLIFAGIIMIIIGLLLIFGKNKFGWFGKLPGDVQIEKENYSIYIPITTMLIISAVLSFVFWITSKFLK